jgi:hypothetical protein
VNIPVDHRLASDVAPSAVAAEATDPSTASTGPTIEQVVGNALPDVATGEADVADPWRRLWARLADLWLELFVVSSVLVAVAPAFYLRVLMGPGKLLAALILLPLALMLDTAIMAVLATTPGKAIAGIKARDLRGRN